MLAPAHLLAGTAAYEACRTLPQPWGVVAGVCAAAASHGILDGICGVHALGKTGPLSRPHSLSVRVLLAIFGLGLPLVLLAMVAFGKLAHWDSLLLGGTAGWFGLPIPGPLMWDWNWVLRDWWFRLYARIRRLNPHGYIADAIRYALYQRIQPEKPWAVSIEVGICVAATVVLIAT